jgi:hypothetical protein
MKKYLLIAALLAGAFWAVKGYLDGTVSWKEDVRLPDGRIVTLSRSVGFRGGTAAFGSRQTESKQRIEFVHPDSGQSVAWTNPKKEGRLNTLALGSGQNVSMTLLQMAELI